MKFVCKVFVTDRQSVGIGGQRVRFFNSTIALCKIPKSDSSCLLWFSGSNKNGVKYNLKGNIVKASTRFANEGRATIQFKEPPHDMMIQADVIQLKSFLHTVSLILQNNPAPFLHNISVTPYSSKDKSMAKQLIIRDRKDYPTRGFPVTLERLQINELKLHSLSFNVSSLVNLKILDISNNCITSLPVALSNLPNLAEINASSNSLHESSPRQWDWMGNKLSKTLITLNLSRNRLQYLPLQIIKLRNLKYLNIEVNDIKYLPNGIGNLKRIKSFLCANNKLVALPIGIKNWNLDSFDLSSNNFESSQLNLNETLIKEKFVVNSLKECAARTILCHKLSYGYGDLPGILIDYLGNANYCLCGKACFEYCIVRQLKWTLNSFTCSVLINNTTNQSIPVVCCFCSFHCYNLYYTNLKRRITR